VESRSTWRPLRRLVLDFVAGEDLAEPLGDQFRGAASSHRRTPITDDEGGEWKVGTWTYSYRDNGSSMRYDVELVEIEKLVATRLKFGGLDVELEFYREEDPLDERARIIVSEFLADEAMTERLRTLADEEDYFDLVRVGIADQPISVRIGRALWEPLDGEPGNRRFQVPFVTEEGDDDTTSSTDPRSWNTSRVAIRERARLRALVNELVNAGVIDDAARARIEQTGDDSWKREWLDLFKVTDVALFR
jgi:hypothetical protein